MISVHVICNRFIEINVLNSYRVLTVIWRWKAWNKEKIMMKQNDVNNVRNSVMSHAGEKVKVRINKGRHKIDVTEGVITETYPSIFLIKIQETKDMPVRIMSYSYTDVLTKDVELILCS